MSFTSNLLREKKHAWPRGNISLFGKQVGIVPQQTLPDPCKHEKVAVKMMMVIQCLDTKIAKSRLFGDKGLKYLFIL